MQRRGPHSGPGHRVQKNQKYLRIEFKPCPDWVALLASSDEVHLYVGLINSI